MKNILIVFAMTFVGVSSPLIANADDIAQNVNYDLAKVETEMDACGAVMPVNKLIALGKKDRSGAIVDSLVTALKNDQLGIYSKSGAAMALGQIGDARAIADLQKLADTATDAMLKSISQDAISLIKGEFKSEGKIYVYSFAIKKLKTDCESGLSEIVK